MAGLLLFVLSSPSSLLPLPFPSFPLSLPSALIPLPPSSSSSPSYHGFTLYLPLSPPLTVNRLPVEQRRGYKNVFDALLRIAREEGKPLFVTFFASSLSFIASSYIHTLTFSSSSVFLVLLSSPPCFLAFPPLSWFF